MSEILARGPVSCSFITTGAFDYKYRGGVFIAKDKENTTEPDHDVEIVGWGETDDGTKYWLARNSWGTFWGVNGWFKILRGENHQKIEEDCAFAVFDISEESRVLNGELVGSMDGLTAKPQRKQLEDGDVSVQLPRLNKHSSLDDARGVDPVAGLAVHMPAQSTLPDVAPIDDTPPRGQQLPPSFRLASPAHKSTETASASDGMHVSVFAKTMIIIASCFCVVILALLVSMIYSTLKRRSAGYERLLDADKAQYSVRVTQQTST
jgi:hypothetical protein